MKILKRYLPSLLILAVLLSSACVGVALAKYVTDRSYSGSITISANLGTLYFKETPYTQDDFGAYTVAGTPVTTQDGHISNTYHIIPGVDIPKNTALVVNKPDATPAYIYLIVETNISSKSNENDISVIVNSRVVGVDYSGCWTKLDNVHYGNGTVYVYHARESAVPVPITTLSSEAYSLPILAGNIIEVREHAKLFGDQTKLKLDFSAFMYQAVGEETAEETWLRNYPETP